MNFLGITMVFVPTKKGMQPLPLKTQVSLLGQRIKRILSVRFEKSPWQLQWTSLTSSRCSWIWKVSQIKPLPGTDHLSPSKAVFSTQSSQIRLMPPILSTTTSRQLHCGLGDICDISLLSLELSVDCIGVVIVHGLAMALCRSAEHITDGCCNGMCVHIIQLPVLFKLFLCEKGSLLEVPLTKLCFCDECWAERQ